MMEKMLWQEQVQVLPYSLCFLVIKAIPVFLLWCLSFAVKSWLCPGVSFRIQSSLKKTGFIMRLEFGMVLRSHLPSLSIAGCCHSDVVETFKVLGKENWALRWFQKEGPFSKRRLRRRSRAGLGLTNFSRSLTQQLLCDVWIAALDVLLVHWELTSACKVHTLTSQVLKIKVNCMVRDGVQRFGDVNREM